MNARHLELFAGSDQPSDLLRADERRLAFTANGEFRRWFEGSVATDNGCIGGEPAMVFRGCSTQEGRTRTGPEGVRWFTSSRLNASFFEDGLMQNAYLQLRRPLVVRAGELPPCCSLRLFAQIALRHRMLGQLNCEGVVFLDVVDGTHPGTTFAVFPDAAPLSPQVLVVGRTRYDAHGQPVFEGLQPSTVPVSFGRSDRPPDPDKVTDTRARHMPWAWR